MPTLISLNELARSLSVTAEFLLETLQKMGAERTLTHSSSIGIELAEKVRLRLGAEPAPVRSPDATSVLEFLPESNTELALEPDAKARMDSFATEVAEFREKGPLEPLAASHPAPVELVCER